MEPRTFDVEQALLLPPGTESHILAKDQPQYRPLPVALLPGMEGRMISRWTLTPEERAAIAAGEDLYLEQLTFGRPLQPILPTVGLRDLCPMDVKG